MSRLLMIRIIIASAMIGFFGHANALVIGTPATPDRGNCYPFGCPAWGSTYQQVYGWSNFSGAIAINTLSFYHTAKASGDATAQGTYTISLSTTGTAVDGLDTNPINNIGADNTVVFNSPLPEFVPFGGQMDLTLTSSFFYDPSLGNLLMTVNGIGIAALEPHLLFDVNESDNDQMSRMHTNDVQTSWALVTGFNEATNVSVQIPEPSTFLLISLGLAGIGFRRYKLNSKLRD